MPPRSPHRPKPVNVALHQEQTEVICLASEAMTYGKLETALAVLGKEILCKGRVNPGSMSVILATANMSRTEGKAEHIKRSIKKAESVVGSGDRGEGSRFSVAK